MGKFKNPQKIRVSLKGKDEKNVIKRAKILAKEEGMTISGTAYKGSIKGPSVDGDYLIRDGVAIITLREAPTAPWFLVKSTIINFIKGK
jgi:hypothetical protein